MFGRSKRWKLAQERAALEERQKQLREYKDRLDAEFLMRLQEYDEALVKGDEKAATLAMARAEGIKTRFEAIELKRKEEFDMLGKSSSIGVNDNARKNNTASNVLTGFGMLGGFGLGLLGTTLAYKGDQLGSLVNKGALGWAKGFNPFSLLRKR